MSFLLELNGSMLVCRKNEIQDLGSYGGYLKRTGHFNVFTKGQAELPGSCSIDLISFFDLRLNGSSSAFAILRSNLARLTAASRISLISTLSSVSAAVCPHPRVPDLVVNLSPPLKEAVWTPLRANGIWSL